MNGSAVNRAPAEGAGSFRCYTCHHDKGCDYRPLRYDVRRRSSPRNLARAPGMARGTAPENREARHPSQKARRLQERRDCSQILAGCYIERRYAFAAICRLEKRSLEACGSSQVHFSQETLGRGWIVDGSPGLHQHALRSVI